MDKILRNTIDITKATGAVIMGYYRDSFTVKNKSPDNPVTDADFAADTLLKERLTSLLPSAGWLSEETLDNPARLGKRFSWVVDPLDGTKEFVMGIPEFSVSVALVEDGKPVVGVIYNPTTEELYYAAKNRGAFLNNNPIIVSNRAMLAGATVDASRSERNRGEFEPFEQLVELYTMGSIAYKLARVAAGQADATWSRGPKNEWDICAGVLLIQEAGGQSVDLDGATIEFNKSFPKVNGIIADNGHLHEQVLTALSPFRDSARVD
jgi:myo-inositol-1(or 4)-monophosphatase